MGDNPGQKSRRSFPFQVPFLRKHQYTHRPFNVEITRSVEQQVNYPSTPLSRNVKFQRRSKLNKRSIASLSSIRTHYHHSGNIALQSEIPGVFTPSLPPELWLIIFQYAAARERPRSPASHTFLTHTPSRARLHERILRYNTRLKWKASLTTVCWFFNGIAQEILYEDIWIGGVRDGRKLAERLGGAPDLANGALAVHKKENVTYTRDKWWIRLSRKKSLKPKEVHVQPPPVGLRPSYSSIRNASKINPGRFIRRLRVETPSMDKCSPHDLLLILQHCPQLLVFEDCKSIRRPIHPLVITGSEVVPFGFNVPPDDEESAITPILTTDALAHTILSRPLKRLTWTNYAHDGQNFERAVRLYTDFVGPLLDRVGQGLEVLEVISCSEGLGMGAREARRSWVVAGNAADAGKRNRSNSRSSGFPALQGLGFGGGRLAELALTAESVTTRRFVSLDLSGSAAASDGSTLTLPCLSSLKVALDNATFFVLSCWSMPALRNLSIISADARYGAEGFRRFFEVHGDKIEQLEMGHSSGEVEEFWLTEQRQDSQNRGHIQLDTWCPNLKEFICSADAEWNWETPDWIAPHVLLPSHGGLEFIGVRGLERRLIGDADEWVRRRRSSDGDGLDDPYFMLLQQFGSMLREEAFPSLRFVRDMSRDSDVIRRDGPRRPNTHVVPFWRAVLERCSQRGVALEDYRGLDIFI